VISPDSSTSTTALTGATYDPDAEHDGRCLGELAEQAAHCGPDLQEVISWRVGHLLGCAGLVL
jgi:hypothetical protein